MDWLDKLPYSTLIIGSILLGLAPFFPIPHLLEKLIMLKDGNLKKPIDIFDLLMHSAPLLLLALKLYRDKMMG